MDSVCEIQQRQRTEPTGAGELSRTVWDVFLQADAPTFDAGDTLLVGEEEFRFEGEPWKVVGDDGVDHVEATVIRTAGAGDSS